MRHNKKINHLGRTSSHRQAMLSNMASSLIKHKRIFTTLAKAKALRKYVEPLVTKSKEDSTHSRRIVFASLQDKVAVTELFTKISEKVEDRPGGYTRIIKTGNRLGDNASMCFIELVDYNENMLKATKKAAGKTRRSRKKPTAGATPAAVVEEANARTHERTNARTGERSKGEVAVKAPETTVEGSKGRKVEETKAEVTVKAPDAAVEAPEAAHVIASLRSNPEKVPEAPESVVEEPKDEVAPEAPEAVVEEPKDEVAPEAPEAVVEEPKDEVAPEAPEAVVEEPKDEVAPE